ncbi:MAG: cytidylate kinase-like family protein [Nitrospinaceae bacterium]|nr:cytidylate kinase-like family protein [Nitrospinaceae bacterium]
MPTTMPETLADGIIGEKIAEWETHRKLEKERKVVTFPFLTISRQFGCGEETLVPELEKTLGWKVYGRNLLDHIAQRESLSRSFIETLDENNHRGIDDWINYLIRSGAILQKDYVVKISQLMKVIIEQESAIILGRGGNRIFAGNKQGLNVRFVAPLEDRVKSIAALRKISTVDAERLIQTTDEEREEFHKSYFNEDINDSSNFDACFNTSSLTQENICKTIALMSDEKQKSG